MKRFLQFATALCLTTAASLGFADTFKFKSEVIGGSSSNYHPGLDLNSVESMEITAETSMHHPHANISRLKIDYENATDFIATDFTFDGSVYRTVVNGPWIYKKVIVELHAPNITNTATPYADVRIIVPDFTSNTNDPNFSAGADIANVHAQLANVTNNPLADITNIIKDDKNLALRLLERATLDLPTGQQGFKIDARWLGHGNRTVIVPAPFPPEDFTRFKAIGIDIDTITQPDGNTDHLFRIRYEDEFGYVMATTHEPLQPYLDQAYPPTP